MEQDGGMVGREGPSPARTERDDCGEPGLLPGPVAAPRGPRPGERSWRLYAPPAGRPTKEGGVMRAEMYGQNMRLSPAARAHVERRVRCALGRLAVRVGRVRVGLSKPAGRRGAAKQCR